jgi:hypothetical protein
MFGDFHFGYMAAIVLAAGIYDFNRMDSSSRY